MGVFLPDVTLDAKREAVLLRKRLRKVAGEGVIYPPSHDTEVANEDWWTDSVRLPGETSTVAYVGIYEILFGEGFA